MCTGIRFTGADGAMYFGRNLDWSCGYGQRVLVTPRGFARPWAFPHPADEPKPLAVIGMAVEAMGIPLYFDCANEAGLAVAGLNFPGYAHFAPQAQEGRFNIAAYEFPLWVASEFTTVDEVEEALAGVTVVAKPVGEHYPVSLLHWMIADASRSIVVECREDGMHVFHDDVDVLTNQPAFDWHRENVRNYLTLSPAFPANASWGAAELAPFGAGHGMLGLPGGYTSASRFVRAAYLNASYPAEEGEHANVARLFRTLGAVSMVKGAACMADGTPEVTLYTGGYSAATQTYYYSTYDDPAIRAFALADYDLDASELAFAE